MKCKTRTLFIGLALSVLIGCLISCNSSIYTTEETPSGTLAEAINQNKDLFDKEEAAVSELKITHELNEGDALRHFSKTKRINNSSSSKYGLVSIKRNHILYSPPFILESCRRFPSGLIEARLYLISLGKLII